MILSIIIIIIVIIIIIIIIIIIVSPRFLDKISPSKILANWSRNKNPVM